MEHNIEHHSGRSVRRNSQRTFTFTSKQLLIFILVIVVLFAILLIWKLLQINSLRKEQAEREQQLKEQTQAILINADKYYLQLLAKPYVWAVRTEMMKGNISQVNLYANDLIKEKNFQSIIIADNKGIIVSSTDKKMEGLNLSRVGNKANITSEATIVDQINDSLLVMTSPIMGFNSRLGTLMISYSPKKPVIK